MTTIYQSRTGTRTLVSLFIASVVGLSVVGCSTHPTTLTGASTTGTISTSAPSRALVDVAAVWATHPLPDCPKAPIGRNGGVVPSGLELPTESTVSEILGDVKSPGSESWVREQLGWLTQWLLKTRADIISDPGVGAREQFTGFEDYVSHVRAELQVGKSIPSDLDSIFPEGCA